MKWRTFLKRESRYWKLEALQARRYQFYVIRRPDGVDTFCGMTDTQNARWARARALYYEAYRQLHGGVLPDQMLVRQTLCDLFDRAVRRPVPPGRRQTVVKIEKEV